jgi:hypothetical protein
VVSADSFLIPQVDIILRSLLWLLNENPFRSPLAAEALIILKNFWIEPEASRASGFFYQGMEF